MSLVEASRKLEESYRAIGEMLAAPDEDAFTCSARAFAAAIDEVLRLVAQLGFEVSDRSCRPMTAPERLRRMWFDAWHVRAVADLRQHPLASPSQRVLTVKRVRRPTSCGRAIARIRIRSKSEPAPADPAELYFEHHDTRPALDLCGEYLEHTASMHAEAEQEATRLGLAWE